MILFLYHITIIKLIYTFNVNTLKIELKEVRKQKESLNARENEIINRIIDSKY